MASLILAAGNRRDCFVAVDPAGGHHSPNKKFTGLTFAEIRQRLGNLDGTQLPSVDQAQRIQRARSAAHERQRASREFSVRRKIAPEASQQRKHGGGRTGDDAISHPRAQAAERIIGMDDATPIPDADASGSTARW